MYKAIGLVLATVGTASGIYFNNFSPTAPDTRPALISALIFATGLALLLIHRSKNQSTHNAQDDSSPGA